MYKVLLYLIAIFSLLYFNEVSYAQVNLVDNGTQANAIAGPNQTHISTLVSAGQPGDFEILICATRSDGSNKFLGATPGWTTLDSGSCGGGNGCILGIFTRTDDSTSTSVNDCDWVVPTNVSGSGSFRYSGVDPNDFFIDVKCNTGIGGNPTAPSILTSTNSAVVRTFTSGGINNQEMNNAAQVEEGGFGYSAGSGGEFIEGGGDSLAFDKTSRAEEFEFEPVPTPWRACTIAFGPKLNILSRPIPILSEWGLITIAAGMGIIGLFFVIRRRRANA